MVLVVPDPGSDSNSDNGGVEAAEERGSSRTATGGGLGSGGVGSGGAGSGGVGSGGVGIGGVGIGGVGSGGVGSGGVGSGGVGSGGAGSGGAGSGGAGSGGVGSGGVGSSGVGSGGATLNAILVGVEHLSAKAGHSTVVPELLQTARILVLHVGPALLPLPAGLLYVGERRGVEDTSLPATNIRRTVEVASSLARSFAAGEALEKSFIHLCLYLEMVEHLLVHSFLYTGTVRVVNVKWVLLYILQFEMYIRLGVLEFCFLKRMGLEQIALLR